MKTITYVGTSDIRSFSEIDPVGVELTFLRHQAVEVKNEVAKVLLEDERYQGEFIEGEYVAPVVETVTPDQIDASLDDSGAPLPGL